MPVLTLAEVRGSAVCPRCRAPLAGAAPHGLRCGSAVCELSREAFPVVGGQPALVDFVHSIVTRDGLQSRAGTSAVARHGRGGLLGPIRRIVTPPNRVSERHAAQLLETLARVAHRPVVLVVGGGTVGNGAEALYTSDHVGVLGFDIYSSPSTAFIADGHSIPLSDGSVDAVWVQAVLEHVLEPTRVVAEIHRVLRPDGLVYAETPFLQAVHEGPWDFTRFTESGHRWLFRAFERLDSGVVAGPGLVLSWAADHLWRGWARSGTAGKVARVATAWLAAFDGAIPERFATDGASCVFFFGKRSERTITPAELVAHYRGSQRPGGA